MNAKLSLTNRDWLQISFVVTCSCLGTMAKDWPIFFTQTQGIGAFSSPKLLQRTEGSLGRGCHHHYNIPGVNTMLVHSKHSSDTCQ